MLLFFSLSLSFGERITSFSLRLDLPSVVSFYVWIIHNSSLNDNMFMFVSLFPCLFRFRVVWDGLEKPCPYGRAYSLELLRYAVSLYIKGNGHLALNSFTMGLQPLHNIMNISLRS